MKTVPIVGTGRSVTFFEDDKIETVRQLIALEMETHPDRLFIEANTVLPANYYSSSPKHWGELFFRLSADGKKISLETMRTYLTEKRVATEMVAREFTKEEWDDHGEGLAPLYTSEVDFSEWRILGVPVTSSVVLPLPPRDVDIPSARIPLVSNQPLYETLHPYEVTEFRVTPLPVGASEIVKRVYYPVLGPDTPVDIKPLQDSLESTRTQMTKLLKLDTPKHNSVSIMHAKWYIGFQTTEFPTPLNRFEQIFYGLTVSRETPYIGMFTGKTYVIRHKFFVEDPKNKTPLMNTSLLKQWLTVTLPQRRKPTLLLYRGTSRTSFDRIAITDTDITIDIRREGSSTETLEEMQKKARKWMLSLDALVPYIDETDLDVSRWELASMTASASYSKAIPQESFDMRRFPCLRPIFSYSNNSFRLLRADTTLEGVDPRVLTAYQILSSGDSEQSPEQLLLSEMGGSIEEARALVQKVQETSTEVNLEKAVKAYPTILFSQEGVLLKFVSKLDRTLHYANILRHVLTSDSDAVNDVCPRRLEEVAPTVVIPQQVSPVEEENVDEDLLAALGLEPEEPAQEEVGAPAAAAPSRSAPAPASKGRRTVLNTTFGYFLRRLQTYDSETFDVEKYPGSCDKSKQVIVLTPEDKKRIGPEYNFESASEKEKLELTDPEGTAICPPYWCMRDEIPLREDQLVIKEDGQHCPMCDGKVRTNDKSSTVEFSVIKRDIAMKYPKYLKEESTINKRKMPCCYKTPLAETKTITRVTTDTSYVFNDTMVTIPELRMAFLSSEFTERLGIKTNYEKSTDKGRLMPKRADFFRVGLGYPRTTLPVLLGDTTPIVPPKDAPENVKKCSFFRTWRKTHPGDSTTERIIASIDQAYTNKTLTVLEELEYVTTFLKCRVILLDSINMNVTCGFWNDILSADARAIAVMGSGVLGHVSAVKIGKKLLQYTIDLQKSPFTETIFPKLLDLHTQACSTNMPQLQDALKELARIGEPVYELILDPFERVQAVMVPGKVILPIQPTISRPRGFEVRSGYIDVTDEDLPDGVGLRGILRNAVHPGFQKADDIQNINGQIVEFLLKSGFRVPIQPEDPDEGPDYSAEVMETVRKHSEEQLVEGVPNKADLYDARKTAYQTEMYEFLLFSLSKDIQPGESHDHLYGLIRSRSPNLYRELKKWYEAKSYAEAIESPISFINKIRTPCGQFKTNETACKESSLCGWHAGTCKIKVNPVVDKHTILNRLAKSLRDNEKQRGLVLDDRLSPFFSTVLYLEMPNELITTVI